MKTVTFATKGVSNIILINNNIIIFLINCKSDISYSQPDCLMFCI